MQQLMGALAPIALPLQPPIQPPSVPTLLGAAQAHPSCRSHLPLWQTPGKTVVAK